MAPLRVVVATPTADCVAARALAMEGVAYDLLLCEGDRSYGEHLARLWCEGDGFIVVEHDIAPWVGAVQALQDCEQHWCAYAYWMHQRPQHRYPTIALGCTKFGPELLRLTPTLPAAWQDESWRSVDGRMLHALRQKLPGWPERIPGPHEHGPPVAHARRGDG